MKSFIILVTGSRTWPWDRVDVVEQTLRILADSAFAVGYGEVVVRHGACPRGADVMADRWAIRRWKDGEQICADRWPADWSVGRRAGFDRNSAMVHADPAPDVCVAFIRDLSTGATSCVELAERAGITTQVIHYEDLPAEVPS